MINPCLELGDDLLHLGLLGRSLVQPSVTQWSGIFSISLFGRVNSFNSYVCLLVGSLVSRLIGMKWHGSHTSMLLFSACFFLFKIGASKPASSLQVEKGQRLTFFLWKLKLKSWKWVCETFCCLQHILGNPALLVFPQRTLIIISKT